MNLVRPTTVLLVALVVPAVAAAQPVSITGVVEKVSGPAICLQQVTHRLACTDVLLRSATVDLDALVGQTWTFVGQDVGVTCHVVEVESVVPPKAELGSCGTPATGCPLKITICPSGAIGRHFLFAAAGSGYAPIDLVTGTLLLAPPVIVLSQGPQRFPCVGISLVVPDQPALIGAHVFLQAAQQDVGPVGPPFLTNPICFQILPGAVPCMLPDC